MFKILLYTVAVAYCCVASCLFNLTTHTLPFVFCGFIHLFYFALLLLLVRRLFVLRLSFLYSLSLLLFRLAIVCFTALLTQCARFFFFFCVFTFYSITTGGFCVAVLRYKVKGCGWLGDSSSWYALAQGFASRFRVSGFAELPFFAYFLLPSSIVGVCKTPLFATISSLSLPPYSWNTDVEWSRDVATHDDEEWRRSYCFFSEWGMGGRNSTSHDRQ